MTEDGSDRLGKRLRESGRKINKESRQSFHKRDFLLILTGIRVVEAVLPVQGDDVRVRLGPQHGVPGQNAEEDQPQADEEEDGLHGIHGEDGEAKAEAEAGVEVEVEVGAGDEILDDVSFLLLVLPALGVGVGWARPKNFRVGLGWARPSPAQARKTWAGPLAHGPKIVICNKNTNEIASFCILEEMFFHQIKIFQN